MSSVKPSAAGPAEGGVRLRERHEKEQPSRERERMAKVTEQQEPVNSAEPLFENTDKYRRAKPILRPEDIRI